MTYNRRLPFLAFAMVAATHAAPQYEANPTRLSNDFVFRALAKETSGNVAIAPGGPLAALAALGAAENPLPELAKKRLGGSSESAEKILKTLDRAEQGLRMTTVLRHARSAWLTEPAPVEPSVVAVRPASEGRQGLRAFMSMPPEQDKETKPAGLASITTFEATNPQLIMPLPKEASLKFDGKPVYSLSTSGSKYSGDDIAETVAVPLNANKTHFLVLTVPRDGAKLDSLMAEVGARVEQVLGQEDELAYVQFPRIANTTLLDSADALGLTQAGVTAETRTFVTIGSKPEPPKPGARGIGGGGGGGISMRIWRPMPPLIASGFGMANSSKTQKVKEIPNVRIDRPFTYAVVEQKSRTVLLAGVVRKVEPIDK